MITNLAEMVEKNQHLLGKPIRTDTTFYRLIEDSEDRGDAQDAVNDLIYNLDQNSRVYAEELLRLIFPGERLWQFVGVYHVPDLSCHVFATRNNEDYFLFVEQMYFDPSPEANL